MKISIAKFLRKKSQIWTQNTLRGYKNTDATYMGYGAQTVGNVTKVKIHIEAIMIYKFKIITSYVEALDAYQENM